MPPRKTPHKKPVGSNPSSFPQYGVDASNIIHTAHNQAEKDLIDTLAIGEPVIWFQTMAEAKAFVAQKQAQNPTSAVPAAASSVGSFLSNISQRAFAVRVAEVVLGGALIIIGLGTLFPHTQFGQMTVKLAGKAAKVV